MADLGPPGALAVNNRGYRLGMGAVILLATALRGYRLGYQELRGDEAFGYFFSLRPYPDIIRATIALREPHPVGSYFIERGWLALAGHSEFALRFISLWFGVLAVALLYRLARRLRLSPTASLLGAGLLAISPYAVWHSQDARMYSISLALTLASVLLGWELWQRAPHRGVWRIWAGYVAVTWLALQVHYFAAFVIVAQNVFVFAAAARQWITRPAQRADGRRRRLTFWLTAQLAVALLYLPWLLAAAGTLTAYGGNGDSPAFGDMLVRSLSVFGAGESIPASQRPLIALAAAALLLIGAARLAVRPASRPVLGLLALYLALPVIVTWLSALSRPIFNERYLIAAAPPFYLLIACAIFAGDDLRRSRSSSGAGAGRQRTRAATGQIPRAAGQFVHSFPHSLTAACAALILLALLAGAALPSLAHYYTDPAYSKTRGWRQLAAAFDRLAAGFAPAQASIAQNYPDPTLWYYYTGPLAHVVLPPRAHDADATAQSVNALAAAGVDRVILPLQPSPNWDDQGIAAAALDTRYARVAETQVGVWPVQVYDHPFTSPPLGAAYRAGIVLQGAGVAPTNTVPGGVIGIHLRWRVEVSTVPATTAISLQLLDARGALLAQTDRPFIPSQNTAADGAWTTSYGILIPAAAAQGDYQVVLALYDPAQPGAPRLLTRAGADTTRLGTITVR
jgi:hypothetical protein